MMLHSSPMEQMVFDQLKWIERRRLRIFSAIAAHFDRAVAQNALSALDPPIENFNLEARLDEVIEADGPRPYLRRLAYRLEFNEARMIRALCKAFPGDAVREQILLGARHAGQEAGRNYHASQTRPVTGDLAELYSALAKLTYSGLPSDKYFFASIRPFSDISIHYRKCVHQDAWAEADADLPFMCDVQCEWMDGILDILSSDIVHLRLASIAKGDSYGRDQFIPREKYVPT